MPEAHRPLLPPPWFVQRYNENSAGEYRTALDPLVMLLWHTVTAWEHKPFKLPVTGI